MDGRRFDNEPKLNMKKVIGVIVAFAVIIMFIVTLVKLLQDSENTPKATEVKNYFSVYTGNKWGVIDNNGSMVIYPTYEEMILIPSKQNPIFICTYDVDYEKGTYKTKVINEKGEQILTGYDAVEPISNQSKDGQIWYENNVYKVRKDEKYGLIDGKGKEILSCNYDQIESLAGIKDTIVITNDSKKGLCNNYGNIILNAEYKSIEPLGEGNQKEFIIENEDEKFGIIGSDKNIILELGYEEISPVSSKDLYVVKEDGNWKIINKDKSVNITEFDEVKAINDKNIIIKKDNKYGVINTEKEEIISAQYEDLNYAYGENYIAKKDNKYGVINLDAETKIDFIYKNISYQKEADIFIADKEDIETDIINNNFEVKLTGILSKIDIDKGFMRIRESGEYKYYNFKFEEKKNVEILTSNTIFLDKKDGKYGYINNRGDVVVDYIYDDATEQNEYGYASVNKEGKWGSIDKEGKIVAETKSDLSNNEVIDFIGKWHLGADSKANYYTDI